MSQPNMMNQNLPNGVPPQFTTMQSSQDKLRGSYNGLESSHSSRESSPLQRLHQIPSSQLPPLTVRMPPTGQLPPSRSLISDINQSTQDYARLSILGTSANEVTPYSSPKVVQPFSTSTPILVPINNEPSADQNKLRTSVGNFKTSVLSPVFTQTKQPLTSTQSSFTHSATSQFTNVLRPNQNIPEVSNNLSKVVKTVLNTHRNTPESQMNETVSSEGKQNLDEGKQLTGSTIPQQPSSHHASSSQIPFDVSQRSTISEQLQKPAETVQPKLWANPPQQTSASHLFSSQLHSQVQTSRHPLGQNQNVSPFPQLSTAPSSINQQQKVNFSSQPLQNVPLTSSSQFPQPVSSYQQFGQQKLTSVPPNTQKIPLNPFPPSTQPLSPFSASSQPVPSVSNLPNARIPHIPENSQPATSMPNPSVQRLAPNPFPTTTQPATSTPHHMLPPNINPMARPKMQPSLSQPRLNASMPPSPYSQQHLPPSNPHGSMPNLAQTQTSLPGPPQSSQANFAHAGQPPPQNLQTVAPPNQNQGRPAMHSSRYPLAQAPVSAAVPQQPYQTPQTYQQQSYYQNQGGYQSQPPSQYQNQHQIQSPSQYQNQPPSQYPNQPPNQNYKNMSVAQEGFSKLWGNETFDLLQSQNILPPAKVEGSKVSLGQDFLDAANCRSDIFRCTVTKIPESSSLLQKSRLPLGVLIHPFKDLNHLPVIQCNTIVRCRACRTYINPFVFFVDSKRWKCNLCYRVNELPEEFQYDPVSRTYGDPSRRPEIKASTIEYIAPAEYMLRPPQPAVYLFLLDVSRLAVESGYLHTVCNVLSAELSNLPGDARTHIGFLAYDSTLHFYSLSEGLSQPHEMTVLDIDDVFLPCPDNLLVNLQDRMELISDLLSQLPTRYTNSFDTGSALGAALQVAYKMMAGTGGRVTVFQAVLPTLGPGALTSREDPNQRASTETPHLNPANDFYKRLALECSVQQIAMDLFILNSQYIDLATISGISRFSGGCMHHFPLFKANRLLQNESLERCFRRYVTRKIGFEAVMRIRCTRGLSIHTFHGNFFVRSTDLLSLPNVNPDAGFGMQVAIEETLSDVQTVCFQAALLYTSSKGERRIRVHTMCLPVANNLTDVINSADQQCIIGLLSKMAVDRSMQSSLSDAREAFLNVAIDILSSYKLSLNMDSRTQNLLAPQCLKLLPLYISALLKSTAFKIGTSTRLDDRVKAMCDMKAKPLPYLIQNVYPDLYPVHNLEEQNVVLNDEEEQVHVPPRLQLTARNIDLTGAYLLDAGEQMIMLVCCDVSSVFIKQVLGVAHFTAISEEMYELPVLENPHNQRLHTFINYLNDEKPFAATLHIMRENSPNRGIFLERLIEDRLESSLSYHEFLQHIKTQVK